MDDPSPLTALRDILGLEGAEERLKDLLKETKDDVTRRYCRIVAWMRVTHILHVPPGKLT
jgi:hypothetical protein